MRETVTAPEGVELGFTIFLISPETGLEVTIVVTGLSVLEEPKPDVEALAQAGGILELAQDWRLMTRDEIQEYKANE